LTPLEQKYSCETSEWALCTLMTKYKKKYCYDSMLSFIDVASDTNGDAKTVRTTGSPSILSDSMKIEVGN
jgi:hypothetical protein